MPEIGTSGLMSGDGKRGGASASVLAPVLDSTSSGLDMAHALLRAVSRLVPTPRLRVDSVSRLGVAMSGDAARTQCVRHIVND